MAGADEIVVGERIYTRDELREQQREWYAHRPETAPRSPYDPDARPDEERPGDESEDDGKLAPR